MRLELPLIAGIVLVSAFAHADAVYLQGGRVLEGSATIAGDKVTVELESGRVSFASSEVVRIEKATAPQDEVQQREKKLARDDVAGMLELANYCREHGLMARERALLERVVARDPEHTEARHRLGFVREGGRWVLRSEQLRKERLAQQEQRQSELARKRAELELELAALRRDRAQTELKQAEAELARERAPQVVPPSPSWSSPVFVAPAVGWGRGSYPSMPGPSHSNSPQGSPINGMRSPQSYFDDAYRTAYGRPPPR
jgi:hypothetical protein